MDSMMKHQSKETALVVEYWSDIPKYFTGVINHYNNYHWFVNGEKNREDGPAVIYSNGERHWYCNKKFFLNIEKWFEQLTPEQKEKAVWNMDNW